MLVPFVSLNLFKTDETDDLLLQRGVFLEELLGQVVGLVFGFLLCSSNEYMHVMPDRRNILFRSTMAKSAPEVMSACDITNPNPRAPPVTTATVFSSENWVSVRLNRIPLRVGE